MEIEKQNALNMSKKCPDCGCKYFYDGPHGGRSRNIKCVGCGRKFCYCPPFEPLYIDNDDKFYNMSIGELL